MSATMAPEKALSRYIVNEKTGCHEWTGDLTKWGHARVSHKGKVWGAHRLAYVTFKGPIPAEKPVVRHMCHNAKCINPEHLEIGTVADNNNDAKIAGRSRGKSDQYGEKNTSHKYTDAQVQEIRELIDAGLSNQTIAKMVNLKWRYIWKIRVGRLREVRNG